MYMSFHAVARNFFLFMESTGEITRSLWNFLVKLFLAYHRTFGIFLIRAEIWEQVLVGSMSSNVHNDLEGSLII